MLSRQVSVTYSLASCINTALAEINEVFIQLFAFRWECCPTILAKCGDAGWVGAGKRRAKGCGPGLLKGGGADSFDAAGGSAQMSAPQVSDAAPLASDYAGMLPGFLPRLGCGAGRNGLTGGFFAGLFSIRQGRDLRWSGARQGEGPTGVDIQFSA